eukprot:scaffold16043_cov115-Isochrysis_galbana.AAC.3
MAQTSQCGHSQRGCSRTADHLAWQAAADASGHPSATCCLAAASSADATGVRMSCGTVRFITRGGTSTPTCSRSRARASAVPASASPVTCTATAAVTVTVASRMRCSSSAAPGMSDSTAHAYGRSGRHSLKRPRTCTSTDGTTGDSAGAATAGPQPPPVGCATGTRAGHEYGITPQWRGRSRSDAAGSLWRHRRTIHCPFLGPSSNSRESAEGDPRSAASCRHDAIAWPRVRGGAPPPNAEHARIHSAASGESCPPGRGMAALGWAGGPAAAAVRAPLAAAAPGTGCPPSVAQTEPATTAAPSSATPLEHGPPGRLSPLPALSAALPASSPATFPAPSPASSPATFPAPSPASSVSCAPPVPPMVQE